MQRLFLSIALVYCFGSTVAQTLFTYGKQAVSSREFMQAFRKNNPDTGDYKQAVTEYLNLYTRFRLKVQFAYDHRMDTLPNQLADAAGFRKQIEDSYLTDTSLLHTMTLEAWERSQKEISLSHIFIPFRVSGTVTMSDSLVAKRKILEIQDRLRKGESFDALALQYSADPDVARNKGRLGYITVFTLPYALENAAYALAHQQVSGPVMTSAGYHLLKKTGERPASGRIKVAQILVAIQPPASASEALIARKLADSLYSLLKAGADFGALATNYSHDKLSFSVGGMLPEFGIGQYDPVFEEQAFSLQQNGDFTVPFQTGFGFHILKKISHTPVITDPSIGLATLQSALEADPRNQLAKEAFMHTVLQKARYRSLPMVDQDLWNCTDTLLLTGQKKKVGRAAMQEPLFKIGDTTYTVNQWLDYLISIQAEPDRRRYPAYMDAYVKNRAMGYYKSNLEAFNPAVAVQMREFRDGNLLFEVMEKQVWNKAGTDTMALRRYYTQHQQQYQWAASADLIVVHAQDAASAADAMEKMKKDPANWRSLSEQAAGKWVADSGRLELTQIPELNPAGLRNESFSKMSAPDLDGTISFYYVVRIYPGPAQRSFEDARGMVMNDYQLFLENQWIDQLKKKYPVDINQREWSRVLNKLY